MYCAFTIDMNAFCITFCAFILTACIRRIFHFASKGPWAANRHDTCAQGKSSRTALQWLCEHLAIHMYIYIFYRSIIDLYRPFSELYIWTHPETHPGLGWGDGRWSEEARPAEEVPWSSGLSLGGSRWISMKLDRCLQQDDEPLVI